MDAVTAETGAEKKPAAKERPRSPLSGAPVPSGRPKGVPNKITRTIREAIELASQPGQCHPRGLAGWLVDRARGGPVDRQIFAGMVGKVIPLQIRQEVSGGIAIQLGWLQSRGIGAVAAQSAERVTEAIEHKANPAIVDLTINQVGDAVVLRPSESLTSDDAAEHVPSPTRAVDRGL